MYKIKFVLTIFLLTSVSSNFGMIKKRNSSARFADAVNAGDLVTIHDIKSSGKNLNIKDLKGPSKVLWAAINGQKDILKRLLEKEKYINCVPLALICASFKEEQGAEVQQISKEIIEMMLAAGYDINAKNNFGLTTLMTAINANNIEVVKSLLANSQINVNAENNAGSAALMLAVIQDKVEIVRLLLNHPNIDIDLVNILVKAIPKEALDKKNPALSRQASQQILSMLQRKSMEVKAQDNSKE